jgi:hypothetical protein
MYHPPGFSRAHIRIIGPIKIKVLQSILELLTIRSNYHHDVIIDNLSNYVTLQLRQVKIIAIATLTYFQQLDVPIFWKLYLKSHYQLQWVAILRDKYWKELDIHIAAIHF